MQEEQEPKKIFGIKKETLWKGAAWTTIGLAILSLISLL